MEWDTITVVVTNVDVGNAINRTPTTQRVDVILSSQSLTQPYQEIKNGLKVQISVTDASRWSYFVPPQEVAYADASPNPFQLRKSQQLLLPINEDKAGTAEVYFYNSSLDLSYSGKLDVVNRYNTRVIEVPTSKVISKLSSGIYFIIAKTVNKDYKWKVAVIR
jgi:hypothetical protein